MIDGASFILLFFICYGIGGIPFGLMIGKFHNIDIRTHGSGNIGATNLLRVCGKRWGYLCFLLDALKGFIPVLMCGPLFQSTSLSDNTYTPIIAVLGVISGHIWSPYLRFKGGKGVATSAGAVMAIAPIPILICLILWYFTFLISRYVSLASIVAALSLPIAGIVLNCSAITAVPKLAGSTIVLLILLALIVIIKHMTNIKRLLQGTEHKFTKESEEGHEDLSA